MINENTISKKENHTTNFTNPKYSGQRYAGFWIRLAATLLDFMIIFIPLLLLGLFVILFISRLGYLIINYDVPAAESLVEIILSVFSIVYSVLFLSSKMRATPGKMLCSIYVATKDNHKLTILRAIARYFCSILSSLTFGIGFLMIAFTKEKTAFHDLICSTRVFHKK